MAPASLRLTDVDGALTQIRAGEAWLDVRSESEFAKGALPGAVNAPILNDDERRQVGTCYKNSGQQAAIELGHRLVDEAAKAKRVAQWRQLIKQHRPAGLYCWRGGLRSQLAADWLRESGSVVPRLQGGYKALRSRMLQLLDELPANLNIRLLGGQTGSGKTTILKQLDNKIDLEGLANHRGSAFGARLTPQPTPVNFEHKLAASLLQANHEQQLWLEDEGAYIGALHIPAHLKLAMQGAGVVLIQEPREVRVNNILAEYISAGWDEFQQHYPALPVACFQKRFEDAAARIQKRLGGVKFKQISSLMRDAFNEQAASGDLEAHKLWIDVLLADYYDPMYNYQQNQKSTRILFAGDSKDVLEFIQRERAGPVHSHHKHKDNT